MEKHVDTAQVICRFNQGDNEAYKLLFHTYYNNLFYFAYRLLGNKYEAENIVQDKLAMLWEKRSDFETETNVKAFLFISVRNACLDHITTSKRQKGKRDALQQAFEQEIKYGFNYMESNILAEIYEEIERLPEHCRNVFKLIFFSGLENDQIARQLNISIKTVRSHKRNALKTLKMNLLKKKLYVALVLLTALERCWEANQTKNLSTLARFTSLDSFYNKALNNNNETGSSFYYAATIFPTNKLDC